MAFVGFKPKLHLDGLLQVRDAVGQRERRAVGVVGGEVTVVTTFLHDVSGIDLLY